jgi:hypothetical protein
VKRKIIILCYIAENAETGYLREAWAVMSSGGLLKQYATILGVERPYLNGVMNGRPGYKGSPELVDRALKHAGLDWKDVLHPPIHDATLDEDKKALLYLEGAILRGGEDREDVVDLVDWIQRRERRRKRPSAHGEPPIPPKRPRERNIAIA